MDKNEFRKVESEEEAPEPSRKVKRVWSKLTYNGYRIVSLSSAPDVGVKIAKRTEERDSMGYAMDSQDYPRCPSPNLASEVAKPWGLIKDVPLCCQGCEWLYKIRSGAKHDCLLDTRDKNVSPEDLVSGKA